MKTFTCLTVFFWPTWSQLVPNMACFMLLLLTRVAFEFLLWTCSSAWLGLNLPQASYKLRACRLVSAVWGICRSKGRSHCFCDCRCSRHLLSNRTEGDHLSVAKNAEWHRQIRKSFKFCLKYENFSQGHKETDNKRCTINISPPSTLRAQSHGWNNKQDGQLKWNNLVYDCNCLSACSNELIYFYLNCDILALCVSSVVNSVSISIFNSLSKATVQQKQTSLKAPP